MTVTPVGLPATLPVPRRPGGRRRRRGGRRAVLAVVVGLIFLVPFYWLVTTSLNPNSAVYSYPPSLIPHFYWANYVRAWNGAPWLRYLLNTVLIAGCTVILCVLTSLLAGFAFGVMRFPGRKVLFAVVLSVLMVPQVALLIPDFQIASFLGWLDTYWVQIIPWGASVFGVFLVRQFLLGVPPELFEAAELDGAGRLRILWSIGAPLARPALIIIALNTFMASWNSFVWPSIMLPANQSVRPVELGLYNFLQANGTDYTALCAAVAFTTVPVLVLFLLLQRHFITGAFSTAGGVRG
ncbi:MAG TPA: carbohydrate ABC transporter permease [Pseudonocardiaceae bacterium]|nr:carbohydrate ABC transporter permease [Pseudonocardiaceae bacterium]